MSEVRWVVRGCTWNRSPSGCQVLLRRTSSNIQQPPALSVSSQDETSQRAGKMTGHIRRRGERSWEIKFDTGRDSLTGRRLTKYHSFKGTKREAAAELVRLKAVADKGEYIDPSKVTLSEFLDRWETWAETQVSAKTLERYKELASHHIRPHLGGMRVQKLRPVNFAALYGKLQCSKHEGGAALAPRTVGHVHRLMHRVLGSAVQWGLLAANPVATAKPPRVSRTEIEILA